MKVEIHSRMSIKKLIEEGFPKNTAVISFYTPQKMRRAEDVRTDYSGVCEKVFYIAVPDIDLKCLSDYGYTYDTYIEDIKGLAEFIYKAKNNDMDIICQCDFGQSRSAACAAAILEHFEGRGIEIFADYRYYPNQLVYHKVYDALKERLKETVGGVLSAVDPNIEYAFEDVSAMLPNETEKSRILDEFMQLLENSLEFIKTTKEFKTVDMQRYLKCGHGDTGRILDALLLLGIITKIENTPVKFKVVLKGEDSEGSSHKKDIG